MRNVQRKKIMEAPEFQKSPQLNIKHVRNTRTPIRQSLRSFIPLQPPEERKDFDPY